MPNTVIISRSTAKARALPARASISTSRRWADGVGACTASLAPLVELIRLHVLGAARLHGDDTTVPVLATGKTRTGRGWTYVRDDPPFAGPAPPAAVFFYSRNRDGEHPQRHLAGYGGILPADAYGGGRVGFYAPRTTPAAS